VRKYDASGTELWTRTFDGGGGDVGYGIATDGSDNVLVTGYASVDIWVRKYDGSGTVLWTRTFDSGGSDFGYGIAADSADNVLVAGSCADIPGEHSSIWVRKYTP
jgi:hypothetical protein